MSGSEGCPRSFFGILNAPLIVSSTMSSSDIQWRVAIGPVGVACRRTAGCMASGLMLTAHRRLR